MATELILFLRYPYNYHVYRVLQPITVLAGPIAPWFGQRGQGVQYVANISAEVMLNQTILERVDPATVLDADDGCGCEW